MEFQHQTFSELLKTLFQNNLYEKAIHEASRKYKIKHYRIQKLKPSGIKNLLKKNSKKQKPVSLEDNNYAWAEGQLKIFVWLLVGFVYVKKIDISDMNQSDFQVFAEIFQGYSPEFLHYQAKFLIKRPEKVNWTQEEARLLSEIIKVKFQQKNWNTVAYELYLISDRNVFRTPKQCRERWLNHEDPAKKHSEWKIQQDLELLRFVKTLGKKWSSVSKLMNSTRTEHMVKNRFTSLVKKVSKTNKFSSEKDLIDLLIKQKKAEKAQQQTKPIETEIPATVIMEPTTEINIQLKEIQNPYDQPQCKKYMQRENQYFLPINLVPEFEQQEEIQTEEAISAQIMNFFQHDDAIQAHRYQDFFFTVPQPTKQI